MSRLKEKLADKILEQRPRTAKLLKEFGEVVRDVKILEVVARTARSASCSTSW